MATSSKGSQSTKKINTLLYFFADKFYMRSPWESFVYHWLIFELWIFTEDSWQFGVIPKMISSVFTVLIMRALLSHHLTNQSTLPWYSVGSSHLFNKVSRVESSEYFNRNWFGKVVVQSEVYKVNNTGELIQPWGTPTLVVFGEESLSFTLTSWTLFERNE